MKNPIGRGNSQDDSRTKEFNVHKKNITTKQTIPDEKDLINKESAASSDDDDDEGEDETDRANMKPQLLSDILLTEKLCHTTSYKINLSDVTYATMRNNILATNHIVMLGLVTNIVHFIMPLRSKCLSKYPPIVILNEEAPTEKQWAQIAFFPEIYFVNGSALNDADLHRCNIKKASKVVLLSTGKTKKADEAGGQEDLMDATTIFKYFTVAKISKNIPIITELVHPKNISFLIDDYVDYKLMRKYSYYETQTYASGEIYISSVCFFFVMGYRLWIVCWRRRIITRV
jgi:hypothetical protein